MLIGVIVWKGIYDLVETGTQQLFYNVQPNAENEYYVSLIFTAVLGYATYFLWLLLDKPIRFKAIFLFNKFYATYIIDLIDFCVYLAMVAVWRVIWQQFDIFAYDTRFFKTERETGIFVSSLFAGCICLFSILGLNCNFFGLANATEHVVYYLNEKNVNDFNKNDFIVSTSL